MAYNPRTDYATFANTGRGPLSAPLESPQEYKEDARIGNPVYNAHPYKAGPYGQQASATQQQYHQQRQDFRAPGGQHANHRGPGSPQGVYQEPKHRGQAQYGQDSNSRSQGPPPENYNYGSRNVYGSHPDYEPSFQGYGATGQHSRPSRFAGHQPYQAPGRGRPPAQRSFSDEDIRTADYTQNVANSKQGQEDAYMYSKNSPAIMYQPKDGPSRKPGQERITNEPESPETLAWDNPFPTFPSNKINKPRGAQADGDSSRPQTASSRPQTANGRRSQDSARTNDKAKPGNYTAGSRHAEPEGTTQNTGNMYQQNMLPKPTHRTTEVAQHQWTEKGLPQAQSAHVGKGPQQTQRNGPSSDSEWAAAGPYFATSPPQNTRPTMNPQRSNTLPNGVPHAMVHENMPFRSHDVPSELVHQPLNGHAHRQQHAVADVSYLGTAESGPRHHGKTRSLTYDIGTVDSGTAHVSIPVQNTQEDSYIDLVDGYYDNNPTAPRSQRTGLSSPQRSPYDEDLPNFDAIPRGRTSNGQAMLLEQQLHIQPLPVTAKPPPMPALDNRGRSDGRAPENFSRQAHRSRSQPNIRERSTPPQAHHGFVFGTNESTPPLPSSQRRPNGPGYQNRPADGWNAEPSSSPGPPLSPYPQHMNSPRYGPSNPRAQGFPDPRSVKPTQRGSPAPKYGHGNGSGPTSPSSMDARMNYRQGGTPVNGSTFDRPMASPSLPSAAPQNPDALPHHPTPVRPGLMQQPPPNQAPKPRPVRQYDSVPSPVPQPSSSQVTNAKAIGQGPEDTPVTHEELQRLRQVVQSNPNDQKTQLILAKKMVEAAATLADGADAKIKAKNRERYILDAHKLVKKLVSSGYPEAMFYLADCHGRGLLGLEADVKEAFNLYQSAAKVGHAQSAYRVAVCCEMGQEEGGGTRRDPLRAVQWYKRAATLGDTPAMYKMGMILLKGLLGQPVNSKEAIVWLKRAAERADRDNPHALHELGLLFESASGNDHIVRDEAYAKQLFMQAAELGYKFSQFRLGSAYEYGKLTCTIDPRQSIAWYSKAAAQEEHQSELALSGWYLTGLEGVLQQSDTEAYLWARKAAQAGLAKAEYAMGYFTEVGIGAPANMEDAKRWYWRAASQNFPKARERLEEIRKGGAQKQKSRVSRSAVSKQSENDCRIM